MRVTLFHCINQTVSKVQFKMLSTCIKSSFQDAIYMYQKSSSRCYLHASKVHFKTLSTCIKSSFQDTTCIKSSIEDATYMLKESQNVLHPVSPNLLLKWFPYWSCLYRSISIIFFKLIISLHLNSDPKTQKDASCLALTWLKSILCNIFCVKKKKKKFRMLAVNSVSNFLPLLSELR